MAEIDQGYSFIKVGEVRPSQMTHTYGVGALVELPFLSVIVRSHEKWKTIREDLKHLDTNRPIAEPRLLAAVKHELGSTVEELKMPPRIASVTTKSANADRSNWVGVWGWPFPRWLRCGRCGIMARLQEDRLENEFFNWEIDAYRPHDAGFFHAGCYKGNVDIRATSVRVVMACPNGHLDDFPWVEWAHRSTGFSCMSSSGPLLKLTETGYGDRPTALSVECKSCSAPAQSVEPAFSGQAALPRCRGFYAHIPQFDPRGCKQTATPMLVGASNMWFADRRSVLSIPGPHDEARRFVDEHWGKLKNTTSVDTLNIKADPQSEFSDPVMVDTTIDLSLIWDCINQRQAADDPDPEEDPPDLLQPEWDTFQQEGEKKTEVFSMKPAGAPTGYSTLLQTSRQLTRLREVVALIGFTRIGRNDTDEGTSQADGAHDVRYARAPLTYVLDPKGKTPAKAAPKWVPAAESLGEGVLIRFDEEAVVKWEGMANAHPRMIAMQEAHRSWRTARHTNPDVGVPNARQVLLHTFSHLLITQMAKDAGYNTASIRERLYSRATDHPSGPMAGVLLYTAEPDAEGTLGGLVSLGQADTLGRLIDAMLTEASVCSTDPYCSEHEPTDNESALHGAACYSCLFVPETSCSSFNRYLDRSFVVNTFTVGDLAYFEK